jgi:signal transduction histidine kinase
MLVLPFYVSVLAQRITDAKQKAEEANQAKDRLLAYVSHQMGKPLKAIIAEYNETVRQEGQ